MAEPEATGPVQIPIAYVGTDDAPILLGNSFLVQHQQDEFILSIGHMAPPILIGEGPEVIEQARKIPFIPVKITARYSMSPARVRELAALLQQQLERYDAGKETRK